MNREVIGTTMRTTPLVRIGTTTNPTTATTILAFVWLCPRIDVLVNSWTREDMFLIAGKCGTLIRQDKGAGSRLCQNVRKS